MKIISPKNECEKVQEATNKKKGFTHPMDSLQEIHRKTLYLKKKNFSRTRKNAILILVKIRFFIGASFFASILLFIFWGSIFIPVELPKDPLSLFVEDRHEETLALTLAEDEQYRQENTPFSRIPKAFVYAVLLQEDQRFWQHGGIDFFSTGRALWQNISSGYIVSGASTLTQQTAKMLLGNRSRTWKNKIQEAYFALRLEKQFSKEEIFSIWASSAHFGGNIVGIEAASHLYFEKKPEFLLPAESVFLAVLPKKPSEIDQPERLTKKRNRVLEKLLENGVLSETETLFATESPLPVRREIPKYAEHFVRTFFSKKEGMHLSTLDKGLQEDIQQFAKRHLQFLEEYQAHSVAVAVVETKTGAIRAYLGNADFWTDTPSREIDMLQSFRSTGSALKPFLYLLAFEELNWNAETILFDDPIAFATENGAPYIPKNFDLTYRGEISVRKALAESRNIPAVETLNSVGESALSSLFHEMKIESIAEEENAGLSAALGSREIHPIDLLRLYLALARGGTSIPLCTEEPCVFPKETRIFSEEKSQEITQILADNTARIRTFGEESPLALPFPVAVKTGTSRDFRDSLAVGFTSEYVVLVWVGNPNAESMKEVSGVLGAGHIFADVMNLLANKKTPKDFPKYLVQKETGAENTPSNFRLLFPHSFAEFSIDPERPITLQKIKIHASAPADFFVDGEKIGNGDFIFWEPTPGTHEIRAESGGERILRTIRVR